MLVAMVLPVAARAADPEREAIDQLNQTRHARGLAALHRSSSLSRSAKRYASRMLRRHYFGHLAHIQVANGFGHAAETIAMHSGWSAAPLGTVRQWMASPHHRELLLSARFHWVGMGLARGRMGSRAVTTWVAHLGTP